MSAGHKRIADLDSAEVPAVLQVFAQQHVAARVDRCLDDQRIPERHGMLLVQRDGAKDQVRSAGDSVVVAPKRDEVECLHGSEKTTPCRGRVELRQDLRADDETVPGRRLLNARACNVALDRVIGVIRVHEDVRVEELPHRFGLRSESSLA